MSTNKILIVLTSHDRMGETDEPTGFHYEELTTPYLRFKGAGYEVALASIKGGNPPHDPGSLKDDINANPPSVVTFLADEQAKRALENTPQIGRAHV